MGNCFVCQKSINEGQITCRERKCREALRAFSRHVKNEKETKKRD